MGEVKYYGCGERAGIKEAHYEAVYQIIEDDLCPRLS